MAANRFSSDDPAEDRVNELLGTLPGLMNADRHEDALKAVTEMLSIARDLAAKYPEDRAHDRAIAGALYDLAAIQLRLNNAAAALTALEECESRYETLGRAAQVKAPALIADVQLRRSWAYQLQGRGASAVVEADKAVSTYCSLAGSLDPRRLNFDLGRVLARASLPLAHFADPDLAVAAADWAIRMYRFGTEHLGDQVIGPEHQRYLMQAGAQSALIHLGSGRVIAGLLSTSVANTAKFPQVDADDLNGLAAMLERNEQLRRSMIAANMGLVRGPNPNELQLTTLAGALAASGEDSKGELSAVLVRPIADCALFVPSQRQPLDDLPDYARKLAEIAVKIMPSKPNEGVRIGLEAHYLFAAASERQPRPMRGWQHDCATVWARVLVDCSDAFERRRDLDMAFDLSSWALGLFKTMMHLAILDNEFAGLMRRGEQQHGRLMIAKGDRAGGEAFLGAMPVLPIPDTNEARSKPLAVTAASTPSPPPPDKGFLFRFMEWARRRGR